jgi:transcriptional regulator with XRE-family HTH domain
MKLFLENKITQSDLFQVTEMNYGQLQRWEEKERLRYSLEIETKIFIEKFSKEFAAFRANEIEEDDTFGLKELEDYKEAGWPTLIELLENNISLLKSLILYHQYEILHFLIENASIGEFFYSINSIDTIEFVAHKIHLKGICFVVQRE